MFPLNNITTTCKIFKIACLKMDNAPKNPKETVSTAEIYNRSWHGRHDMVWWNRRSLPALNWHLASYLHQPTIEGFNNKCTIKFPCPFLHIPELILHGRAIATIMWVAPSKDRSIWPRLQQMLDLVAWTCCTFLSWSCTAELSPPVIWMAPSNDRSICQDCSKC